MRNFTSQALRKSSWGLGSVKAAAGRLSISLTTSCSTTVMSFQVRRAAHQDHLDYPERKRNRCVLGNHRELFCEISARKLIDRNAPYRNLAGTWAQHPGGDSQQRRLASAVAARECDHRALGHLEPNASQDFALAEFSSMPRAGCRRRPTRPVGCARRPGKRSQRLR